MLTIGKICSAFESYAPLNLQEEYDNSGLLIGEKDMECSGVMFCLDVTEEVIQKAVQDRCNLIVAHHPLIFRGLKKISGLTSQGRILISAIRENIAIYACHTNIDNVLNGVNGRIADKLELEKRSVLLPKSGTLKKLVVFAPESHTEAVESSLFGAGAGNVGEYSACSFVSEGRGSFLPSENANPFVGEKGKRHVEKENKIEVIFPTWNQNRVLEAMRTSHPYEEVAFEVFQLENNNQAYGSGLIGYLKEPLDEQVILSRLREIFNVPVIRHSPLTNRKISKIAICGGAGAFLIGEAKRQGAELFITADLKYHDFFEAENQLVLADIGHFESEQYTVELFMDIFREKFPTFAHLKNHISTNPVNYLI
jgi:dinuclear metal center YbgI/SA1388 family protein